MKNGKQLLVRLLAVSFACCMVAAVGTACNKEPSGDHSGNSAVQDYHESGTYYYINGDTEYSISLDKGAFTLNMGGEAITGTYTYDGSTFTLATDDAALTSAEMRDGALVLTYGGTEYTFEKTTVYTVTFRSEGSVVKTSRVKSGEKVAQPAEPEKEGNVFAGWYTDADFEKGSEFYFGTPVTGDITLYARFVEAMKGPFEFTVNFDAGYADAPAISAMETVEGKLYNLPQPERAGYDFMGWWTSDFGDAEKLTAKYEEQTIGENTTLYAVWRAENDSAPVVSVNAAGVSWTAKGINNRYTVTIKDAAGTKVGETTTTSTSYAFDFAAAEAGEYTVTVAVGGGESATAYYRNKALAKVSLFEVEGNVLKFNPVEGAENYLLTIECGTAGHEHQEIELGNKTVYDFSACDMKEGGMVFTVSAEADGYLSSQSAGFVFERHLEKIQTLTFDEANEIVSWEGVENAATYTVTVLVDGQQAYSGSVGTALSYGIKTYGAGQITVQVTPVAKGYNSPEAAEYVYDKARVATPVNLRVEGTEIAWDAVAGAAGYVVRIGDKEHTVTDTRYALTDEDYVDGTTEYKISVVAKGTDDAHNSVATDVLTVRSGVMGDEITYSNGAVHWDPVFGGAAFYVKVNDGAETKVTGTSCAVTLTKAGDNTVSVCVESEEGVRSAWVTTTVKAYTVTFDADEGAAVESVFLAEGDATANLPQTTRTGYDFSGWYTAPDGMGTRYDTADAAMGGKDVTLYASWTAKKFDITFDVGLYGPEEGIETTQVSYDQGFVLPTPATDSIIKAFAGWYTDPNGQGICITDYEGKSVADWKRLEGMTVHAYWVDIFEFSKIEGGYSVSKGDGISFIDEVTVPETYNGEPVTTVNSFAGCTNLQVIRIPDTIKLISMGSEGTAFLNCTALRAVEIWETGNATEKMYASEDGVLFNADKTEILYFPTSKGGAYEIPYGVTTIADNLFSKARGLTEVTIPASVISIGADAFRPSSTTASSNSTAITLTKITFLAAPEGTEEQDLTIASGAFSNCKALTEISLPGRLKNFSAPDAFSGCTALQNVYVTGSGLYSSVDGVLCVDSGAGLSVAYYPLGRTGAYRLPVDQRVTGVAESAFSGCTGLTEITIPAGITSIGANAFYGCTGLTKINFEGTAADLELSVGASAFYGCTGVTSVTLPGNLVALGVNAFGGTKALTTVYVESIGRLVSEETGERQLDFAAGAFATTGSAPTSYVVTVYLGAAVPVIDVAGIFSGEVTDLQDVIVDPDNQNYADVDGVLFDKNVTAILFYPLNRAGAYILPETVTTIGANVFQDRTRLTSITIGEKVATIGNYAFEGCTGLKEVIFTGGGETPMTVGDYAFSNCDALTSIALPVRTTTIGEEAFSYCDILSSVTIPEGVTTIGARAFASIVNLRSITLPASLMSMSESGNLLDVFDYCSGLAEVNVAEGNTVYKSIDGVLYRQTVINPDAETPSYYVSDLMFCPRQKAGTVDIPSTVRYIWQEAFYLNEGVTVIDFSDGLTAVVDPDTGKEVSPATLTLGEDAFYSCEALEKITLPSGLSTIGENTFYRCSALTEIVIPNTVTSLEANAFYYCTCLTTVTFEEGGTAELRFEDGSYSGIFQNCTSLEEITLPERTTYLGKYTFSYCTSLKKVNLPASLLEIQGYAFRGAPLEEVNFAQGSKLTTIGDNAFYGSVITDITLPEGLKTIGSSAFYGSKLTSILIPASVEIVDMAAFEYCTELKELIFADNSMLKEFGNSTCLGCTNLEVVDFGNRAKVDAAGEPMTLYFDRQGFKWCSSLKTFVFPADTTEIGLRMFEGCFSLKSVTFAEAEAEEIKLETIQDNAFWATAIEEFRFPEAAEGVVFDLGSGLFKACSKLRYVYLSGSVASVDDVFTGCASIETIEISEKNVNFSLGELPIIYNQDGKAIKVVYGSATDENGKLTIASGVREISGGAFAGRSDIVSVFIPASVEVIGNNAFKGCVNLKEVIFEEESLLSSLGTYTFQNCYSLQKVVLPENYTSLSNYMFDGCSSLTDVTFSSKLEKVGTYVFRNCTSLKKMSIPATVTSIGTYMFYGCSSLEEVDFNGNVNLQSLGNYMFYNCSSLRHVTLPVTLASLGTNAFNGSGLEEIDLSNLSALKYLGSSATSCTYSSGVYTFANCPNLTTVILPQGLTRIGGSVFRNSTALTSINLEELVNLEMIGTYAFENTGLRSVVIPGITTANNLGTYAFNNCANLEKVVISDGVTRLNNYLFQNCVSLKEVEIPESVVTFQGSVFKGCTSLESVKLPSKLSTFGTYIFADCTALKEVDFSGNVTASKLGDYMFENCTSLKSVTLPTSLNYLGKYTFRYSGLETIDLSATKLTRLSTSATSTSTTVSPYTFTECTNLTKVVLPAGLVLIGGHVFEGCTNLTDIDLSGVKQICANAFTDTGLTNVSLASATFVGDEAFAGTAITNITIPKTLTSIGGAAFGNCQLLSRISVETGNASYRAADDVLYSSDGQIVCYPAGKEVPGGEIIVAADSGIGNGAFAGCLQISKVTISEGITSIGEYGFYCSGVKEVVMPESIKSIGEYAFYGCAIESISLPEGLEEIGTYAFANSELKSIVVPASVQTFGDYAFAYSALESVDFRSTTPIKSISSSGTITYAGYLFAGCEKLASVTLYDGLESIAGRMFLDCTALTEIAIPSTVTTIDLYAFSGSGLKSVVIPETVEYIKNYAFAESALEEVTINVKTPIASVSSTGTITYTTYLFYNCANLSKVNFCEGFNYIGGQMFMGCTSLKSITIPETVETIGTRAFSASGLESIALPDTMMDEGLTACVGTYAFENCVSLTSVKLPAKLEILSTGLFNGCSALTEVSIPSSIRKINTDVFNGCTSLASVVIPSAVYEFSAAFEGWTKEQTIYFEVSEGHAYASWTIGWDDGCDATFVFNYTGTETGGTATETI